LAVFFAFAVPSTLTSDLCAAKPLPARVSKRNAAAEAVEQRNTELFFKGPYLRSDIRLHGVHLLGSSREAELVRENPKDLQLPDFHRSISP
jgi:hypothetical protein